ncbi:hypothetical protein [Pseudoxanthomonas sp.]|uniref:hypothetical protein n=1 Tax=Pseudoxanthomonas sp. TaxID=1871049 RepID=UPI00260EB54D|nr:hypothetical protein [Pseudoxanthomonas sp.]WDS34848.1 MAG: hypothetical protein O8I58_10685 [Pseudoxanthomonas sp.]
MSAASQATPGTHAGACRVPPLPYVPRPALLSLIETALKSGFTRLVLLSASSAMGKTSFIDHELVPAATQWGWDLLRWSPQAAKPGVLQGLFDQLEGLAGLAGALSPGWSVELESARASGPCARLERLARALDLRPMPVLLVLDGLEALGDGSRAQLFAALALLSRSGVRTGLLLSGLPSSLMDAAPISRGARLNMQLPVLGEDYVLDRVERLGIDRAECAGLAQALAQVGHVPQYMDALMRLLAGAGHPAIAFARWQETAARNGFSRRWSALRELDQRLLCNVVQGRGRSLYTRDFSLRLSGELTDGRVVNPQKIQTAINRLVKANILYPTVAGGYEIQDGEMATFAAIGS